MTNSLAVLFGGNPQKTAFQNLFSGKRAADLVLEKIARFPHIRKAILLLNEGIYAADRESLSGFSPISIVSKEKWTKKTLLETLASVSPNFDLVYFLWDDTPFIDIELAERLAERHLRYKADYSFADGYPLGLAPEILAADTAEKLLKINFEDGIVERDALFSVLQKDINAFDIETEIAPFDLRSRRLTFATDSKRNALLLQRLFEAGFSKADDSERFIAEKPEIFRTLPAFFPIQVTDSCPQTCEICPYAQIDSHHNEKKYLSLDNFEKLLDKIVAFSGDAVIDLSLWGELSLHPQKNAFIEAVLQRPALSLIIETSGIGWSKAELEALALKTQASPERETTAPKISWIVSLDAHNLERYKKVRGAGFAEAVETAKTLAGLFGKNVYVQAVRTLGAEDDIEQFYRFWKSENVNVIIQKYDHFCGKLPNLRVSDLSPLERQPCWHLMRDMPVLIDGAVPLCRETSLDRNAETLGNVFSEDLETIWQRGNSMYLKHAVHQYSQICAVCDEYFTYNL